MDANLFFLLKMTHIAALIFWLGPSLGAWWIVRGFRQRYPDDSEESLLAHRLFITALTLEHVAFVALLLSGIAMVMVFSFHWQPWLQWKIMIIAIFLIPLEAADIYWGNIKLARLLKSRRIDEGSINYQRTLRVYHGILTYCAMVLVPVSVVAIFYLAVAKPNIPLPFL